MPFLHPNCLSALPLAIVIASLALILPISVITELSASRTRSEDSGSQAYVVRSQPPVPGIGISLNYDYVAAGIYFENGTSVPVARIDGDAVYRSFMRATRAGLGSGCVPLNSPSQVYTTGDESESLARMLRQLKALISSRLDEPFCFVVASRPDYKCNDAGDPVDQWHTHQTQVLDSALSKVGLYLAQERMIHAAYASAIANDMLGGNGEKDGYVLFIDRGPYGWRYTLAYIDEGYGGIDLDTSFVQDAGELGSLRDAARDALRKFLVIPDFTVDEIRELVISGDLASDAYFQDDLVSVLGSKLVTKAHVRDPIHASALGAAARSFHNINDPLFDLGPGSDCCKKYKGEGCPAHYKVVLEDEHGN
ncbi:unnamed protein product [Clonostachys rosea f. rosea IK726]|uniref:Uncharacterized protein n=1 Tax=Clonostachys rosea f. rosea IK726 TaxID=1349383 RepID=A0ACA9T5T2_BIOOC|nr:unnamed protein product [Clonostachys rosea f. rosea IK726]